MLNHAFQGTFQFDYGIANFLVVGLSVPVVLNGGKPVDDIGRAAAPTQRRLARRAGARQPGRPREGAVSPP